MALVYPQRPKLAESVGVIRNIMLDTTWTRWRVEVERVVIAKCGWNGCHRVRGYVKVTRHIHVSYRIHTVTHIRNYLLKYILKLISFVRLVSIKTPTSTFLGVVGPRLMRVRRVECVMQATRASHSVVRQGHTLAVGQTTARAPILRLWCHDNVCAPRLNSLHHDTHLTATYNTCITSRYCNRLLLCTVT